MTKSFSLPSSPTVSSGSALQCRYIPEPLLRFAEEGLHVNPKAGIARYGPLSLSSGQRHPAQVRVGLVGTANTIAKTRQWMEQNASGVRGNAKHPEFPGYQPDRGFFSRLVFDDAWIEQISQSELAQMSSIRGVRARFEAAVLLIDEKLRLLGDRDQPPDYIVIALPDDLIRSAKVVNYHDPTLGDVHRDFRRAIKASAMKYRIPTQLLRELTVDGKDPTHPSKIAWNFFTGLYFKAGGVPWGPVGLHAGTCYVGVGFFRPLGTAFPHLQTSLVQAFDEHGDGLVLRGHDFEWDAHKEKSRSPHLDEEQAKALIDMVLDRYQQERKQLPRRVVVHKTSRYWPRERAGFQAGLQGRVAHYDLVALAPQSLVRLMPPSKYPPLRGTQFSVGDIDYLYTTGFIAELNEFHGMHVPASLQIADHVGQDTSREILLAEILILTKLNWNSAHFGGLLPITLRFSELVADILREIPKDREPRPQFKFYM
jgi:hypothetical protein